MTGVKIDRSELGEIAGQLLDMKKLEVLARTVFRAIFGKGVRVPLKLAGVMDMDLVIQDTNVIVNLNKLQMQAPEFLIWRFIFAYQGKPVLEYGRGIRNDLKIHLPQLFFLLFTLWRDRRRKIRARARADATLGQDIAELSTTDLTTGTVPTAPG